jgi:hypothetical protein
MISIAVSAVLRPSRLLRMLLVAVSVQAGMIGAWVAMGRIGEISLLARLITGGICLLAAVAGLSRALRVQKTYKIDISGVGQIRLAWVVSPSTPVSSSPASVSLTPQRVDAGRAEVVRLMNGSTLWPYLMLLRLQAEDGRVTIVPVLPDCVSVATFRALAVACRWIAAHNNAADAKIF